MSDRGGARPRGRGQPRVQNQPPANVGRGRGAPQPPRPVPAAVPAAVPGPSNQHQPPQQQAQLVSRRPPNLESRDAAGGGGIMGRAAIRNVYLRTRPEGGENSKKGTTGDPIKLQTNYFRLLTKPDWVLYQYRVDFVPEEDLTNVRRGLMRDHKAAIGGYVFDGTTLYTPHKINPCPAEFHSRRADTGQDYTIKIKLVGDVVPGDYTYYQIFNLIMRKCYSTLNLQLMGRDYFDRDARIDIREHRLQIWPGYKTAIAQHEDAILMVAEIAHKVVRLETVHQLLNDLRGRGGDIRSAFNQEIIGQIVLTDYNNRTYRVDDVNWDLTPSSTFSVQGEMISYADYYQKKYKITIRDRSQPMLVSRAKKRDLRRGMSEIINLVPELCRMTGITDQMRNNFHLMKAISTFTRVSPQERINKLLEFNRRLNSAAECTKELRTWDMKLDTQLVEVPGRVLRPEVIVQGNNQSYLAGDTSDGWTRNLRGLHMFRNATLKRWAAIVPARLEREAKNFIGMIQQTGRAMGFVFPDPYVQIIQHDNSSLYQSTLENVISTVNPEVVLCTVMSGKVDLYNTIKHKCTVNRSMLSQVVTGRTLNNKNAMSIATKVAIQINAKLGGCPWAIKFPLEHVMVIGYDVCHDTKDKRKSFGAMVATMDRYFSRYFSCVTNHTSGEELANEFGMSIKKALHAYKMTNGRLPDLVMIYRDGVGDGQMHYVYEHEVQMVKNTLEDTYGQQKFKMTFIVVSKRLNTRFFFKGGNPKPGTVIDDVVTLSERYDFFLVSQAVRDGTVAPTSYNVLYNTSGLPPDRVQIATYKFCHLYYNFSGQVRVPAPCQYAHKLAFLAGQHLHQPPNEGLNDFLHFL